MEKLGIVPLPIHMASCTQNKYTFTNSCTIFLAFNCREMAKMDESKDEHFHQIKAMNTGNVQRWWKTDSTKIVLQRAKKCKIWNKNKWNKIWIQCVRHHPDAHPTFNNTKISKSTTIPEKLEIRKINYEYDRSCTSKSINSNSNDDWKRDIFISLYSSAYSALSSSVNNDYYYYYFFCVCVSFRKWQCYGRRCCCATFVLVFPHGWSIDWSNKRNDWKLWTTR